MEPITISQMTKMFNVSTRMLRYYEQIGLLPSRRTDGYAYRMYDTQAVTRLQQILLLRKLRIPLKQISRIFDNPDVETMWEVFARGIQECTDEITALTIMRRMLEGFVSKLQANGGVPLQKVLFDDKIMLDAVNALSMTKIHLKEERSMEEVNKAHETLSRLKNVRILRLPPCTVAACHFIGENPEATVGDMMSKALLEMKLYERKPDARMFGFNHPNPSPDRTHHGYEDWATIPDDVDVPAPLVKKQMKGGLYAVHTITIPNFHEWNDLREWVKNSGKYEPDFAPEGAEIMGGCLEEHLNWVYHNHLGWPEELSESQLDLYLPIKLRENAGK